MPPRGVPTLSQTVNLNKKMITRIGVRMIRCTHRARTPTAMRNMAQASCVSAARGIPKIPRHLSRMAYASVASVAARPFTAWLSVDPVRSGPDAALARLARLIITDVWHQLPARANATAERQGHAGPSHSQHQPCLGRHPPGRPSRSPDNSRVRTSIYVGRVAITAVRSTVATAGMSEALSCGGRRWLLVWLLA